MKVVIKDDYECLNHPLETDCDEFIHRVERKACSLEDELRDASADVEITEVKLEHASARLERARVQIVEYQTLSKLVSVCNDFEGEVGSHADIAEDFLNHALATYEIEKQKHAVNEAMLAEAEARVESIRAMINAYEVEIEYHRASREVASELAVLEAEVQTHENAGVVKIGEFS